MKRVTEQLFMKTNLLIAGLLALLLTKAEIRAQIYPDDLPQPIRLDYEVGFEAGHTRPGKFPVVQEELDLDGDGVPEKYGVETAIVNTDTVPWIGPVAGKNALNSLTMWIVFNSKPQTTGKFESKVILKIEPCLSGPNRADGGYLNGMKVSFVRLGKNDYRQKPLMCFLPYLNAAGKMTHVTVSEDEARTMESNMVASYIQKSRILLWKCRKGHTLPDGRVSFGGVWIAFVTSFNLPSVDIPMNGTGGIPREPIRDDE